MQPAQYGNGDNGAKSLAGSCQVRARLIVIRRVGTKNPPQVRLTAADHLVQTFATQGADQTFRIAILPRRLRRNRSVADTHGPQPRCEDMSVGTVIVAHQVRSALTSKGTPQ